MQSTCENARLFEMNIGNQRVNENLKTNRNADHCVEQKM